MSEDKKITASSTGKTLVEDVSALLREARIATIQTVNSAMVETYWHIGKRIVEEEQKGERKASYGEKLLQSLSVALSEEFGKGFSYANLRNFRQFFLTYPESSICYALRSKLSWTQQRLIMRVDDSKARDFYLRECEAQGWSSRLLERNIASGYYQRVLSSQTGKEALAPAGETPDIRDFLKDPYVLEFLGLPENGRYRESALEDAIVTNLQKFLIDLKSGKLAHQDIGQMDMYVRMFDDLKRGADDNPTIGIILCSDKDETVVKYSVLKESEQLFAARYKTVLPTEAELAAEIDREKLFLKERAADYCTEAGNKR